MKNTLLPMALLLAALAVPVASAQMDAEPTPETGVEWTRRTAEHLLNRAGFGATPAEVDLAVARGLDATLERLFLSQDELVPLVSPARESNKDGKRSPAQDKVRAAGGQDEAPEEVLDAARSARASMRRADRGQLGDYTAWWFDTMVAGEDPLRDRLTLFWHGYFTSSMSDVKSSYQMIQQNQLLRNGALGSFAELLYGIAKDPAMLEYLDNDENRKGKPNENFAREVMELFTLGEGHYTEDDIQEAARAFTGWRNVGGDFRETKRRHDRGEKTVLGVTGRLDGEDVLGILLADEQCATFVAGRLIEYLEGVAPTAERLTRYAELFRTSDYSVEALLRALFADPDFYRDEVLGTRVAGPVDYLVGTARRLDVTPPRIWLTYGSQLLGQELFFPPNVKGWDEGLAWITTANLMQRGNLAGVLLGVVDIRDVLQNETPTEGEMSMDELGEMDEMSMEDDMPDQPRAKKLGVLARFQSLQRSWRPPLNLAGELARRGARSSAEVVDALCDQLLAIELPADTRAFLIAEYDQRRSALKAAKPGPRFVDRRRNEDLLRSFAHLVLSLPEAQLN